MSKTNTAPASKRDSRISSIESVNWGDEEELMFLEEVEEEAEIEEIQKELSYEIYEAPQPEEVEIPKIIKDSFGFYKKIDLSTEEIGEQPTDEVIYRYTMCNKNGVVVQLITLGATITSIRVPDSNNVISDVVLGFNNLEEYMSDKNQISFGSTIGRFNGFIYNSEIKLGKKDFLLSPNLKGVHHDRGGFYGFDKAIWQSYVSLDKVIMSHVSPHMEEGYPGDLLIQISFQLRKDNCLVINTTASTSQPTILSTAQNIYFNLAGHETGPAGLGEHSLLVNADKYVKVDNLNIPTGDLSSVGSTYFDLRVPRPVWKAISRLPEGGYNHVFCLTKGYPRNSISFACRLVHPPSGRYLEITTDMPGLFINTGTTLPNPDALPPTPTEFEFNEEDYPAFCREEKMKEKQVKQLQAKLSAKLSWPKKESLPEPSTVSIPFETEEEKDIPRKDKNLEPPSIDELKEASEKSIERDEFKGTNTPEDTKSDIRDVNDVNEKKALGFLKDIAESDEEERVPAKWTPPKPIIGKKGAPYRINGGICILTQEYPDSMRYKKFPKPILRPGEKYSRTTVYKFGVLRARIDPHSSAYL